MYSIASNCDEMVIRTHPQFPNMLTSLISCLALRDRGRSRGFSWVASPGPIDAGILLSTPREGVIEW
jgi:hypothetical protein